jgi:hypothetical protein
MGDQTASDMDGGWKQIIEDYLEEFFRFFFPRIHASINFNAEYHFLDKELAKLMVDTETGGRRVDKLIQVQWKDGSIEWILLHVEVQAQREVDFARRMYVYHYRIWDRYKQPVISLALLADGNPNFRPNHFHRERAGCQLDFRFPIVKLLDYKTEEELAADPSPFALASLVQLRKIQAGKDVQQRYQFKLALIREMYSHGHSRDDIIKLLRFIDYILQLPEELAVQLRREVESIEEKFNMPYVTSFERLAKQEGVELGRQEGIEHGVLQGVRDSLLQTIEVRFGQIPEELRASVNACMSTETLSSFHRQALLAKSIDELPKQLS